MVEIPDHEKLDAARQRADLSIDGLWIRYFELGGLASPIELEGFLKGALVPARLEHDVLVHAINEALREKGIDETVDYLFGDGSEPES